MPVLDFRHDRLDYGKMLIPPPGYRLERAIAATYSLDLNTFLSIPVALLFSQTLEGKLTGERFQVLDAISRSAEVVTVYCQEGGIHVPKRYNRLFAFMENMIVQVRSADAFTSFHPKIWVIRYVREDKEGQPLYRVLILTKNLTFDHSWDLAVSLEGKTDRTNRETNRPLLAFLSYLHSVRPIEQFYTFKRDLAKVKFNPPAGFDRITFHPVGIAGHRESPISDVAAIKALCMSPFIDDITVSGLRKQTEGKFWIFGRKREMAKLSSEVIRVSQAYCISERVVAGENMADAGDASEEPADQDLHAKLFVFQQPGKCRWYIGSSNATKAAQERNVEFLVELVGSDPRVTLDRVVEDFLGENNRYKVFEEFTKEMAGQVDINANQHAVVRRLEFLLAKAPLRGVLTRAANETNYDLTLTIDLRSLTAPKGISLSVRPLNYAVMTDVEFDKSHQPIFKNISEADISRFIVYTITEGGETLRSFVVRYEVDNIPDSRLDTIFRCIVSNRNKFFAYLRLILADEVSKDDLVPDPPGPQRPPGESGEAFWHAELPIFERLIVAASRDPRKLREVDHMIDRLKTTHQEKETPMPPGFLDFWEVFRPLIPRTERRDHINGK